MRGGVYHFSCKKGESLTGASWGGWGNFECFWSIAHVYKDVSPWPTGGNHYVDSTTPDMVIHSSNSKLYRTMSQLQYEIYQRAVGNHLWALKKSFEPIDGVKSRKLIQNRALPQTLDQVRVKKGRFLDFRADGQKKLQICVMTQAWHVSPRSLH